MSNPFDVPFFKNSQSFQIDFTAEPEPAPEPTSHEIDESQPVVLKCKICKDSVQRAPLERGNPWIHSDEAVLLQGVNFVRTHDHEAIPDYIEVQPR